jgi:hypothetical protein
MLRGKRDIKGKKTDELWLRPSKGIAPNLKVRVSAKRWGGGWRATGIVIMGISNCHYGREKAGGYSTQVYVLAV